MKSSKLDLLFIAFLSSSCASTSLTIKPNDELVNVQLPQDFSNRSFYQQTSTVRENLDYLVGSILYVDTSNNAEIVIPPSMLKSGATTLIKPVKDGTVYQSKVTSNWKSNTSFKYFFNVNFDFSNEQAYEVILEDAANAVINQDSIHWEKILAYAKVEKPKNVKCRCFVINSWLSTILYKGYRKVDTKTNLAFGDVFQVGNLTYNSESTKLTKDYRVSYGCYDIDKAIGYLKSNGAFNNETDKQNKENIAFLKALAAEETLPGVLTGVIIKRVKNEIN